jgi:hypothetical protein
VIDNQIDCRIGVLEHGVVGWLAGVGEWWDIQLFLTGSEAWTRIRCP